MVEIPKNNTVIKSNNFFILNQFLVNMMQIYEII